MKTINPGAAGLPHDLPIVQTYERIQAAFPGGPLPALAVVEADDVTAPAVQKGIEELKATATGPTSTLVSPNKQVAIVSLPLPGNGTDERSDAALIQLRDHTIPTTIGKVDGTETNVTGITAGSKDFNDKLAVAPAGRLRLRARPGVHPAARHLPQHRRAAEGDRAQPAVASAPPTASSPTSSSTATSRTC